jgi:hypothetical protein
MVKRPKKLVLELANERTESTEGDLMINFRTLPETPSSDWRVSKIEPPKVSPKLLPPDLPSIENEVDPMVVGGGKHLKPPIPNREKTLKQAQFTIDVKTRAL